MEIRKLFVAVLGLVLATPAFAQYYKNARPERGDHYGRYNNTISTGNEIYYGLRLGLGLGTVNSDVDEWDGPSARTGLNVGAIVGIQLTPSAPVYLESGLFYTEKGGRSNSSRKEEKVHYNLNYLELPILVKYCFDIDGTDFSIQPFAGGYLALGVGGKVKKYETEDIIDAFSDDYFKRFDGGLRIGCGAEYQMLYVDLAYEFGLANIGHGEFSSTHTGTFYLNCGVNF